MTLTHEEIRRLPKVELHVHLDGSLRPRTLIDLARSARVELPASDPERLARYMVVDDARNLEDYLRRFDTTIAVLQTPEAIERVAWEMVQDAAADNVRYMEVRYCPELSTREGLSLDDVLEAEQRGLARGQADFGVRTGIINCSLRHYDPAVTLRIAERSVAFRDRGVVAVDLAGGEAGRPPGMHREAFDLAEEGCLGITVHAGEAAGAESIADAVHHCHAQRIGHGTRLNEDPALRDYIRDRRIPIEINITSNIQTRVVPQASAHPVREYFDRGLVVTLCTDSWLMSGTSLTHEYWLAQTELGFSRKEMERMILNGVDAAFLPWPEKQALAAGIREELAALS